MKKSVFIVGLIALFASCGGSEESSVVSKEDVPGKELIKKISDKEEEFHQKIATLEMGQSLSDEEQMELVRLLKEYVDSYPESVLAPEYLDKIHMIFSGMKKYQQSIAYGDSVLVNYPDYINRLMVIESIATTYDFFLQPRNGKKVAEYYSMLLKEDTNMDPERRKLLEEKINNPERSLESQIQEIISEGEGL